MAVVSLLPVDVACCSMQPRKLLNSHRSSKMHPPMGRPKPEGNSHPDIGAGGIL